MSRQYTKVETLSEEVLRRKAAGETSREIGAHFGLSKTQIKGLVKRQNRKQRLIANGYMPRPKDRPRKDPLKEEQKRNNELVDLLSQARHRKPYRNYQQVVHKYPNLLQRAFA